MGSFTYEEKEKKEKFETYEWDNVWIDHANDLTTTRVLYVGDSISCGTRRIATERTNEQILFDGFGTSKAIDNPYFKDSVKLFAKQEPKTDVIIFNNGLHGWHLEEETEYSYHYEEMIKFFLSEYKNTPLIVVLTTYVSNPERNARVIKRNEVAKEIASKYGLSVIDLYKITSESPEKLLSDGVHFSEEGYQMIADEIIKEISELFSGLKA